MCIMIKLQEKLNVKISEGFSARDYDQFIVPSDGLKLKQVFETLSSLETNRFIKLSHNLEDRTHVITLFWPFSNSLKPFYMDTNLKGYSNENNALFQFWLMDREKFLDLYYEHSNNMSHDRLIKLMRNEFGV